MFNFISKYLNVFLVTLIATLFVASLGLGYMYKNEVQARVEVEQSLLELESKVIALNATILTEQRKHTVLSDKREKTNQEFRTVTRELNQFKGKSSVIAKRPELVEKKIQRSFDLFMDDVYCNTGEVARCRK